MSSDDNGKRPEKRPSLSSYPGISQHDLRRVAVEAACDPRVVVKYLRRMPQPSTMRARIEAALVKCDLGRFLVRYEQAPVAPVVVPTVPGVAAAVAVVAGRDCDAARVAGPPLAKAPAPPASTPAPASAARRDCDAARASGRAPAVRPVRAARG
jgi:hypothetical protein